MTYQEYLEKTLTYYQNVEKKSANTINTLRKQLNVFGKYLEDNKLDLINVKFADLTNYIAEKGGKEATINARVNALRKLFSFMVAMEYVSSNPALQLKSVKVKTSLNDEGKVLTEDQMKKLLHIVKSNAVGSKTPKRDYALILLGLDMGLRRSEYTWLKTRDFDLKSKRKSFKLLRKGGMIQKLPLHDHVAEAIVDYIENERPKSDNEELFLTMHGKAFDPDSMGAVLSKMISFLGLPKAYCHSHSIRHSACTSMLRRGVPVTTVQFILSHKSLEITLKYMHLTQEDYSNDFFNYGGFDI